MGPYRVWKSKEEVPGLAMSRSFGDSIAQGVGVISDPEITRHIKNENGYKDSFLVIGSDGLWDFLSNEKCCEVVSKEFEKYKLDPNLDPETAVD